MIPIEKKEKTPLPEWNQTSIDSEDIEEIELVPSKRKKKKKKKKKSKKEDEWTWSFKFKF